MHRILQIIVALTATAFARAQEVAPTPSAQPANTSSIILAPTPAVAQPAPSLGPTTAQRTVSPAIAAEISSRIATYSPDRYGSKAPMPDPRDADKPKNLIPRVPLEVMQRYVVHEARPPVFRARDLYTKAGLIDLSFKEHPGLRIGNFFNLNANAAYEKIINEQLSAARQDATDTTVAMAIGGDSGEMGAMQDAILDESRQSWWPQRPGANLRIP